MWEASDDQEDWYQERGKVIAAARCCRVVEAQMALVRWLVDRLTI
jgi:hypothetical protein